MNTLQTYLLEATKDLPPQYVQKVIAFAQSLNKNMKNKSVQPSQHNTIHPEVLKISGILRSDIDLSSQYTEHIYTKHQ